jgi:hypothetical protein
MENQEEMSVFQGNNRQLKRTEVRYLGASKEQRRRAKEAQTLKAFKKECLSVDQKMEKR